MTFKDNDNERHNIFEFNNITPQHIDNLNHLTFYLLPQDINCCTKLIHFPTIKYKWIISDILNTALDLNDSVVSPSFLYGCFEWQLKFCKSHNLLSSFSFDVGRPSLLYVYLTSLPSEINEMFVQFRVWIGNSEIQNHLTGVMSFHKDKLKHKLGSVQMCGELIIYVEFCIYRTYNKNKITIPKYIDQLAKSNPNTIEVEPYYNEYCSWQIHSTSPVDDLICFGFLRENFGDKLLEYIAENIIETIEWFLQYDGQFTLNHIKNGKESYNFDSPVFIKGTFKLYLKYIPNYNGKFIIQVHSLSSLTDINHKFKLRIKELNVECIEYVIVKKGYNTKFIFDNIQTNNIKHLHHLTIQLFHYNKEKLSVSKCIKLPVGNYKWSIQNSVFIDAIKKAKQNEFIMSPQFSFGLCKWYITLYPNTDNKVWLGLYVASMSSQIKNMYVKCELLLEETNSIFSNDSMVYRLGVNINLENKFSDDTLLEIKNIKTLTVSANICIYDTQYYKDNEVKRFHVGDEIKVKDRNKWYLCKVIDVQTERIKLHYIGWSDKWDEYIKIHSDRLKINNQKKDQILFQNKINKIPIETFVINNSQLLEVQTYPAEYIWEISNLDASNSFGFKSKIFTAYSLKWLMTLIYPNGKNKETTGIIQVSLHLLSLPSKDLSVYVTYIIHLIEIDYKWTQTLSVGNNKKKLVDIPQPNISRKRILDLKSVSIKVEIQNINVYRDVELVDITDNFRNKKNIKYRTIGNIKPQIYIWNIPDGLVENGMNEFSFASRGFNMYGMEWYLSVSPAKKAISLCTDVSSTSAQVWYIVGTFTIIEHNINYIFNANFCSTNTRFTWSHQLLSQLINCTIKLELELIDVYNHSRNVTRDYADKDNDKNDEKLNKLTETMNVMAKNFNLYDERLNKLMKTVNVMAENFNVHDERLNKLMKTVNVMAENQNKFTETMNNMISAVIVNNIGNNSNYNVKDREINELKSWLNNHVKLPQYYSLFIKNGIDNLDTVKLIGVKELDAMGIALIGHKLKILHHVEILNEQNK
eukprot:384527_1